MKMLQLKFKHKRTQEISSSLFAVPDIENPLDEIKKDYDFSGVDIIETNCFDIDKPLLIASEDFIVLANSQRPPDRECAQFLEDNLWDLV